MWHIINPKLAPSVDAEAVKSFLEDLLYISIDMNLNILGSNQSDNSSETSQARKYLEECKNKKKRFLDTFMKRLDEPINKETLGNLLKKDFCKSYSLRLAVAGREMAPMKS